MLRILGCVEQMLLLPPFCTEFILPPLCFLYEARRSVPYHAIFFRSRTIWQELTLVNFRISFFFSSLQPFVYVVSFYYFCCCCCCSFSLVKSVGKKLEHTKATHAVGIFYDGRHFSSLNLHSVCVLRTTHKTVYACCCRCFSFVFHFPRFYYI